MVLFFGVLAQLARARDWQSRGQRFKPAILHFFCSDLLDNQLTVC